MANGEFEAAERERRGEGVVLRLGGREWQVRRKLPFGLLAALAAALEQGQAQVLHAFAELVAQAVVKDQREELRAAIQATPEDDDQVIDIRDLVQAAETIIQGVTGSPFGSPSGSPATPSGPGGMSLVPATSGGSTSPPHRRVRLS